MQIPNDKRPIGMTNYLKVLKSILLGSFAVWVLLSVAYSIDRHHDNAWRVATMTVLILVPPLITFYSVLALTQTTKSFVRWTLYTALACSWVLGFRFIFYPLFGFPPDIGENVSNSIVTGLFGVILWYAAHVPSMRMQLNKIQLQQKQAELQLLRQQLAPHTFFNFTAIP